MPESTFHLATHDLPRQAGQMLNFKKTFNSPERIGIEIIAIDEGSDILLEGKIESVSTGILATFRFQGKAKGECVRCLDRLEVELDSPIQELYYYQEPAGLDEDDDLVQVILDEMIDLLPAIRDAVVLDLPLQPRCSEQCLGLCNECGEKLTGGSHTHPRSEPRWSALAGLQSLITPKEDG